MDKDLCVILDRKMKLFIEDDNKMAQVIKTG